MNETTLVRNIIAAARKAYGKDIKLIKVHGSIYMEAGTPDIFGVFRGVPFLWEVKVEKGRVTPLQEKRGNEWAAAGAQVRVIRAVSEAQEHLSEIASTCHERPQ